MTVYVEVPNEKKVMRGKVVYNMLNERNGGQECVIGIGRAIVKVYDKEFIV